MKYKEELTQKHLTLFFLFVKRLIKRTLAIFLAVTLIIAIFLSIYFCRDVAFGKLTLSEFKNNFYGIPVENLMSINQQIRNQQNNFKKWLDGLSQRISS